MNTTVPRSRAVVLVLWFLITLTTMACAAVGLPYVVGANPSSCSTIVEQAIKNPTDSAIQPAKVVVLSKPPLPPPATLKALEGHTVVVHMRVSERGLVEQGSVRITGVNSVSYIHEVERFAENMRFRPARLSGCWVPSTAEIRYTFDPSSNSHVLN